MKRFLIPFLFLILVVGTSQAQEVRKYSNEFLSIGVGGRALGMSNAQVASVDNTTAGYWNPAGLPRTEEDLQVSLMHSEYFAGIAKYDYGSVAIPLKGGDRYLGLSVIRFGVDNIPNTLDLFNADGSIDYNNITSFSVADYGFLASYAQRTGIDGLRVGGNFKLVHRIAGSFATAWGFGLDVGAQYDRNNWQFGVMAQDITSTFNAWSFSFDEDEKETLKLTGNKIPSNSLEITTPTVILGAAHKFELFNNKVGILPELNLDVSTDMERNVLIAANPFSIDPNLGLELSYADIVYVRGGVGNVQRATNDFGDDIFLVQPSVGVGLKFKTVAIDYAFTDIANQSVSIYSHFFSLTVGFNQNNTNNNSSSK